MENLGVKVKEPLEENGSSLVESGSAGFRAQISSQSREAVFIHQKGVSPPSQKYNTFINLL